MVDHKDLPKWAIEALARGDSAIVNGEHIMPSAMPTMAEMVGISANYAEAAKQFQSEQEQLYKRLEDKDAEIADLKAKLEAKGKPGPKPKPDEKPEGE
jgi:hypothetical protein